MTTMVPVPSLREYIPPYFLAHSVNLSRGKPRPKNNVMSRVAESDIYLLQMGMLQRHLMKIPEERQSRRAL